MDHNASLVNIIREREHLHIEVTYKLARIRKLDEMIQTLSKSMDESVGAGLTPKKEKKLDA